MENIREIGFCRLKFDKYPAGNPKASDRTEVEANRLKVIQQL